MTIRTERHGDVLAIVCPAGGALDAPTREGIDAAVKQGVADAGIAAMVIRRADGGFLVDGGEAASGAQPMGPLLPVVAATVEAASKPVVAAIGGAALGGGCELALACHYRVAASGATLGLPAATAGLVPGAGGIQRLARIAGVPLALRVAALGETVRAGDAAAAGLVDRVVEGDLAAAAVAFAHEVASHRPLPRAAEREAGADPAAVAAFRAAYPDAGSPARAAAVACVEKATDGSSFADGLAFEHRALLALKAGRSPAA